MFFKKNETTITKAATTTSSHPTFLWGFSQHTKLIGVEVSEQVQPERPLVWGENTVANSHIVVSITLSILMH